jgi:hypothetical protein
VGAGAGFLTGGSQRRAVSWTEPSVDDQDDTPEEN